MAFIFDKTHYQKINSKGRFNSSLLKFNQILFLAFILIGSIGCGSTEEDQEDLVITNVKILPDDELLISMGQELQLEATATNSTGMKIANSSLEWATSNANILSVSSFGLISGVSDGTATISATAGGVTDAIDIRVVDLTGVWVGGELPDTVSYTLTQTGTSVDGVFHSRLGFPPITDVNTGILSGSLEFTVYSHVLEVTTENNCMLEIAGNHHIQVEPGGEIILNPGNGFLSSTNCSINGTIDFAVLRRQ